ncbi:hypothetical protein D3C76_790370 [compost metagenome]
MADARAIREKFSTSRKPIERNARACPDTTARVQSRLDSNACDNGIAMPVPARTGARTEHALTRIIKAAPEAKLFISDPKVYAFAAQGLCHGAIIGGW